MGPRCRRDGALNMPQTIKLTSEPVAVHLGPRGRAHLRASVPFAIGLHERCCEGFLHLTERRGQDGEVVVYALGNREGSLTVYPKG